MAGPLTIVEITRVAVDVVRTHCFPITVLGSVPVSGGSDYVEILVRLDGLAEDRRMLLGVLAMLTLTVCAGRLPKAFGGYWSTVDPQASHASRCVPDEITAVDRER